MFERVLGFVLLAALPAFAGDAPDGFSKKREEAKAAATKDLHALVKEARAKGAPKAAEAAGSLLAALGAEGAPAEGGETPASDFAERDYAARGTALRARHRDAFVKLWTQAGIKGLWKEQAGLVGPLTALGTEDPKVRKALGMTECPAVGWCWVIRTPHYEILTNLPPDDLLEVVQAAEDTYEAFTAFFRPFAKIAEPKSRLVMYYLDTRQQLLDFCKTLNKTAGFGYGFYDPGDGKCYFRKDLDLFGISGVVYHEGTHQLHDQILHCMSGTPVWVTEGLASYFETLVRKDGKLCLGSEGRADVWHLGGAQYIPLEAFLDVAQKDWAGLPDRFRLPSLNAQYGQTALLFRYFMEAEGGKLKDRFLRELLLKSLGTSRDVQKVFGFSPKDLEPKYVGFANAFFKNPVSAP